ASNCVQAFEWQFSYVVELMQGFGMKQLLADSRWFEGLQCLCKFVQAARLIIARLAAPLRRPGLVDDELGVTAELSSQVGADGLGVAADVAIHTADVCC